MSSRAFAAIHWGPVRALKQETIFPKKKEKVKKNKKRKEAKKRIEENFHEEGTICTKGMDRKFLPHSCLEIFLISVVCTYGTFQLGITSQNMLRMFWVSLRSISFYYLVSKNVL